MSPETLPDRRLRVLYIAHTAAPGGSGRSLRFLLQNFPAGRVEPHVLCPPGRAVEDFKAAGARVILIPAVSLLQNRAGAPLRGVRWGTLLRTLWHLQYGGRIRDTLQKVRPDLVHINEIGMHQAAMIAHRSGIPVVMHARSVAERKPRWIRNLTEYLINRYVDQVIAIDESVRWSFRELNRCRVIYNPLPLSAKVEPRAGPEGRTKTRVTFLSGLMDPKGVWDLLECARLLKDRKDIVFQIYGGNNRPKEFYRSFAGRVCSALRLANDVEGEIQEWVEREGLRETVRLFGHVEAEDSVFKGTDVLIFPSHLNGVGRSVFEAGIYGIPSVVTLRDRFEDIVEDQGTGLIVGEKDPRALAEAIAKLAGDRALCARLGENARARYLHQFEPRRIANEVIEIYDSLVMGALGRSKRNPLNSRPLGMLIRYSGRSGPAS